MPVGWLLEHSLEHEGTHVAAVQEKLGAPAPPEPVVGGRADTLEAHVMRDALMRVLVCLRRKGDLGAGSNSRLPVVPLTAVGGRSHSRPD